MDYLQHRENYKIAYHRWLNLNKRLMELFNVSSDAALEESMLQARTSKTHLEVMSEYALLGHQLDAAGDRWAFLSGLKASNWSSVRGNGGC